MFKTHICITVLSEYEIPEGWDLASVIDEANDGDFVLRTTEWTSTSITDDEMRAELLEAGSDPGFFQL